MSDTGETCVLGLDFGSDSVRALVVRAADGCEIASSVAEYPRWAEGRFCVPERKQFRQHPADYLEAMVSAVRGALDQCRATSPRIAGIGVDTTGSSPMPVAADGTALALKDGFSSDPDAMCILWKDHTSVSEAEEINALCARGEHENYIKYVGGIYSSEWYWAKILRVGRVNPTVFHAAANWVELCDYIPALLTGVDDASKIVRSRCAAGHKALWHPDWGGLPDRDWFTALDPCLGNLAMLFIRFVAYRPDNNRGVISIPLDHLFQLSFRGGNPLGVCGAPFFCIIPEVEGDFAKREQTELVAHIQFFCRMRIVTCNVCNGLSNTCFQND